MKKGIFYRILGLILAVTMLFGLTGFTFIGSAQSGDAVMEEEQPVVPVKPDDEELPVKPSTEPTPSENPAKPIDPEPADPVKPVEPTPSETPAKNWYVTVTVEQPKGGTINLAGEEYKLENGTVTVPRSDADGNATVLTFAVNKDSDYVVSKLVGVYVKGSNNYNVELEKDAATYSYTLSDDTPNEITVTAAFCGIKSAEVSDSNAWKQSKTITFTPFGFDGDVEVKCESSSGVGIAAGNDVVIDGLTATVNKEVGANPVNFNFSVTGKVGEKEITGEVVVPVKMIDNAAPSGELSVGAKYWNMLKYSRNCSVTVSDNLSGIAKVEYYGMALGEIVKDKTEVKPDNGEYKFTVDAYHIEIDWDIETEIRSEINYYIVVTDKAGNEYDSRFITTDSGTDKTNYLLWAEGLITTNKTSEQKDYEKYEAWTSLKEVTFKAKTETKGRTATDSSDKITITFKSGPDNGYTIDDVTKTIKFSITGIYCFEVKFKGLTHEYSINYDNTPIEITAKFVDGEGLGGFVTQLNGGKSILFNESFVIHLGTNRDTKDVELVQYQLVSKDKVEKDENGKISVELTNNWTNADIVENDENTYKTTDDEKFIITVTKEEPFTGYIAFRVLDKAGNETIELYEGSSKGENDEFEIVDDSILITNESSYSGDGAFDEIGVSVSAVVEVYGTKTEWTYDAETGELVGTPVEAPYSGEWVQSATFNVDTNVSLTDKEGVTIDSIVLELKSGETILGTKTITYGETTTTEYSGAWDNNGEFVKLSTTNSYTPVLYATVNYTETTVADDGTESKNRTPAKIVETCTVKIDHDSNTPVAYNYVEDDNGNYVKDDNGNYVKDDNGNYVRNEINGDWYNGYKNQLESVNVKADTTVPSADTTVYWELTVPYSLDKGIAVHDDDANIKDEVGGDDAGIKVAPINTAYGHSGEYNLTAKSLYSDNNEADLIDYFKESGVYTLKLTSIDKVGNKSINEYTIHYDPDAPEISVTFEDKTFNGIEQRDNENGFYFVQREATITITDYDLEMGGVTAYHGDKDITDEVKDNAQITGDVGEKEYKATLTYGCFVDGDGKAIFCNGDYNISIHVTDVAGNETETDKNGCVKKNGGDYSEKSIYNNYGTVPRGENENKEPIFTIDQTAPTINVTFSDDDHNNEAKYYNHARTMTVTVDEHNFNPVKAVIKVYKVDNNSSSNDVANDHPYKTYYGNQDWSDNKDNNDEHTATVSFGKNTDNTNYDLPEGKYDIVIEVIDRAGNKTKYNVETFVVDQSLPEITFGVSQNQIFGKDVDCTPSFRATDNFLSEDSNTYTYTMTLTRTVREYKGQDVTTEFVSNRTAQTNTELAIAYSNILSDAKNDGIYTLSVRVTDLAGNESTSSVTFTVNRNGSFYEFSDDLAKLVKDYNNGIYAKKANGKYYVTEYNASDLKEGSVKIVITRDGKPIGESIVPTVGTGNIGESGLYEYVYELPNSYFEQDGVYIVEIFSDDAAGNNSKNFVEPNKESIKFVVDSVSPSINMKQGLDQSIVNGSTHTFKALVQDTYSLRSIEIKVDGKVVMRYLNQDAYNKAVENGEKNIALLTGATGEIEYTLNEKTDVQHVEIVATDMSGNVTTTATDDYLTAHESFTPDVLVSTSFWARYIHNTWALIGTGVAVAVIAAAIWFFLKKKNRSEEEAA